MASRTLPGLGLDGFWDLGEDGWKNGMDGNLRKLSALVQCKVINRVASEPGSPVNGDMYILTAGANANKVAIRDNGVWVHLTPFAGWRIWDSTFGGYVHYDGTAWIEEQAASSDYELLAVATASASASLDFTGIFTSDYAAYEFVLSGLYFSNLNTDFYLRTSADGGATWPSSNNSYAFRGFAMTSAFANSVASETGLGSISNQASSNQILLSDSTPNSAATALSGRVFVGSMKDPTITTTFDVSTISRTNGADSLRIKGVRVTAETNNGIRFVPAAGTITAGSIHCYGIRNS